MQVRLFPTCLPDLKWSEFNAAGFDGPACGVVYRDGTSPAICGVPLGGVDTGCLDLETSGLLGYNTIFNSHVPRGGPLNTPPLGLAVDGQTYVLTTGRTKEYESIMTADDPGEPVRGRLSQPGVDLAREIHYWGHFPVADLEYELDSPVSVGVRAWSPFIPGDVEDSMIPGIVFEVHLRNTSPALKQCTMAISFAGPSDEEAGTDQPFRRQVQGDFTGVITGTSDASFALGAIGEGRIRWGGGLGIDGGAWAAIGDSLPAISGVEGKDFGSSVAVDLDLKPDEERTVRFVLAWHSPNWRGGGHPASTETNSFKHMYATRWPDALSAAQRLARGHESLLRRVLAWQQVLYAEQSLPVWLRQSLVNILHLITEDGMWAARQSPELEWTRPEDGLFGMNESPRGCPQIECLPCSWYGSFPLVYFFPQLALSTLRGYKEYQDDEGCPPWIFGGITMNTPPCEMTMTSRGYQVTQNAANYTDMLSRYWLRTGDDNFLREFYPSVKKAMIFTMGMNTGPHGIISFPDHRISVPHEDFPQSVPAWETEGFEWMEWHGMATHIGGIHLAQVRMVESMARAVGDQEFAGQCQQLFAQGSKSLEEKLWAGRYYINFWDPEHDKKMDAIFAYQLDGQWMTDLHGLPSVFREDRINTTLETIKESPVRHSTYGAINFCNPDGTPMEPGQEFIHNDQVATDFFTPEAMILGMTYMYQGQREYGLEFVQSLMAAVELLQRRTWDQPNIIDGMTGRARFGNDYYQNLVLWALPAALERQDLSGPCQPGGLVDRVIRAGSRATDL